MDFYFIHPSDKFCNSSDNLLISGVTCSVASDMVRQKSGEMSSPTPSIDSLNGVLALCDNNDHPLDAYSHVFSGVGSSSGVSSATSSSSGSSLDRASTGSASSTSGIYIVTKLRSFYTKLLHCNYFIVTTNVKASP